MGNLSKIFSCYSHCKQMCTCTQGIQLGGIRPASSCHDYYTYITVSFLWPTLPMWYFLHMYIWLCLTSDLVLCCTSCGGLSGQHELQWTQQDVTTHSVQCRGTPEYVKGVGSWLPSFVTRPATICWWLTEEVRHGWTLLIKMAEVTLIDLGYCKVESFLAFSMTGLNLDLKTGAQPQ